MERFFPSVDVSASPVYNQVRQEQISAEQDKFERVQQHTVEQIVHVPIPQSQELNMEGVKDIPEERFPQQTVEQIENATPAPELDIFPHEQFDEACRILDLKHAELREAVLRAQRLDLYTDISSQEEYESGKAIVENIQQKLSCLPCPSTSSEDKGCLIEYTKNSPSAPKKNLRRKR